MSEQNKKQDQPKEEFSNVKGINSPEDTRRFLEWFDNRPEAYEDDNGMVHIPMWPGHNEPEKS